MPITNGTIKLKSYEVGTHRHANFANPLERFIYLAPEHPTATVKHLVIYYFAKSVEINDPDIGYQTPGTDHWVVAFAPPGDFDATYKILQTEKPVYFHWAANAQDKLDWFQVTSRAEPIGHN